jgi:DNA helicase-2/ATP-dependent DNA helicase PcrA
MDMPINRITSDSLLIDIEHHFRVSAGPGAGKTHWMVEHIRNVLHRSDRLGKTRKIACITYTNIAVETILNRLGTSADRVEVSTIHSYLYKHIVKPYASFIAPEFGLCIDKMDGHEEPFVNFGNLKTWIEEHQRKTELTHPYTEKQLTRLPDNNKALEGWLSSLHYTYNDSNELKISSKRSDAFYLDNNNKRRYLNRNCLNILETDFLSYKKLYWGKGILFHDDVLFFSYQLIQKFPFILPVLRAKFPYFFVDEFQDISPIQAEILHHIGQRETIVGIIGDKVQSIYGFQGAQPEKFTSFNLPGMADYQMEENRRSTNEIVRVLNELRSDIQQVSYRDEEGVQPMIIVGEMVDSLRKSKQQCSGEKVCSLSRDNITSNAMKREITGVSLNDKLFEELLEKDRPSRSNRYRSKVVVACIKATELAREGKFKDSIKELERVFKVKADKTTVKREALKHIRTLLKKYNDYENGSLYEFYLVVKADIKNDISGLRSGAAKTFYEGYTYQQLSLCVRIVEDTSLHKTIHKAKGDEFDNVLLILREEDDLAFLLNPDLTATNKEAEEQRIYYVAISRAKKRLFVSVPSLQASKQTILSSNFQIEIL